MAGMRGPAALWPTSTTDRLGPSSSPTASTTSSAAARHHGGSHSTGGVVAGTHTASPRSRSTRAVGSPGGRADERAVDQHERRGRHHPSGRRAYRPGPITTCRRRGRTTPSGAGRGAAGRRRRAGARPARAPMFISERPGHQGEVAVPVRDRPAGRGRPGRRARRQPLVGRAGAAACSAARRRRGPRRGRPRARPAGWSAGGRAGTLGVVALVGGRRHRGRVDPAGGHPLGGRGQQVVGRRSGTDRSAGSVSCSRRRPVPTPSTIASTRSTRQRRVVGRDARDRGGDEPRPVVGAMGPGEDLGGGDRQPAVGPLEPVRLVVEPGLLRRRRRSSRSGRRPRCRPATPRSRASPRSAPHGLGQHRGAARPAPALGARRGGGGGPDRNLGSATSGSDGGIGPPRVGRREHAPGLVDRQQGGARSRARRAPRRPRRPVRWSPPSPAPGARRRRPVGRGR